MTLTHIPDPDCYQFCTC